MIESKFENDKENPMYVNYVDGLSVKVNTKRSPIKRKRDQSTPNPNVESKRTKTRTTNTNIRHAQSSNSRIKLPEIQRNQLIYEHKDHDEGSCGPDLPIEPTSDNVHQSNIPHTGYVEYAPNNVHYAPNVWNWNNVYGTPFSSAYDQYYQPMVNMAFYCNWWQACLDAQQRRS